MITRINLERIWCLKASLLAILFLVFGFSLTAQDVNDGPIDGGTLVTSSDLNLCLGDGMQDIINVRVEGALGDSSLYLVTDENGVVQFIPNDTAINFSGESPGVYLIYHLSYKTLKFHPIPGWNIIKLRGWYDLSEPLYVNIDYAIAGEIYIGERNNTEVEICVTDDIEDLVEVQIIGSRGAQRYYVITDNNNIVLALQKEPELNFTNASIGVCYIYHISAPYFTDLPEVGDDVNDFGGCFDISNKIKVTRTGDCDSIDCDVFAGTIMNSRGEVNDTFCVVDEYPDILTIILTAPIAERRIYLITDNNGNILKMNNTNVIDFSDTSVGECKVYNLGYNGIISGLQLGSNISGLMGCYDISNPISIVRENDCVCNVDGGIISTSDGLTDFSICTQDGISDAFTVIINGGQGANSSFLITDENGSILKVANNNTIDLEGADPGICLVWHLAYNDGLAGLKEGVHIDSLAGCHSLSNSIRIIRECIDCQLDAGTLSFADGSDTKIFCTLDGESDIVSFDIENDSGDSLSILITNTVGEILNITKDSIIDFEGVPEGICLIWNLAYDSTTLGIEKGRLITNITGCFDLSNSITITRDCEGVCTVNGGSLAFIDHTSPVVICTQDSIADSIRFNLDQARGDNLRLLITDVEGKILKLTTDSLIDFSGTVSGTCLVWNIAYDSTAQGIEIGSLASDIEGCFDLSNSLTVIRECDSPCDADSGIISILDGQTNTTICTSDGISDSLKLELSAVVGDSSYIIITDTTTKILKIVQDSFIDLEGTPDGICQLWSLAYNSDIIGLSVDSLLSNIEAECFSLSNPVTISRTCSSTCDLMAGMLLSQDSLMEVNLCTVDTIPDLVRFSVTNTQGDSSVYVLTTADSTVITSFTDDSLDFSNTGTNQMLVYNIVYKDSIPKIERGIKFDFEQNSCFAISNPILINPVALCTDFCNASSASITIGEETILSLCISDNIPDTIQVDLQGGIGDTSIFAVTNELGIIELLQNSSTFVFDDAVTNNELIYLINFTDTTGGIAIGNRIDSLTNCFALSNRIQVLKNIVCDDDCLVEGGTINLENGETQIELITNDGISDSLKVNISGAIGDSMQLVITDSLNVIISSTVSGTTVDFEGVPTGVCFIRNIAYTDNLDNLAVGVHLDSLSGCHDLSNAITVIRQGNDELPDLSSGTISIGNNSAPTLDSINICVGDRVLDYVNVDIINNNGEFQEYVITDDNDIILNSQESNQFNLTQVEIGTCYIYHLVSEDEDFTVFIGANIRNLGGDYLISNKLTVTREGECAPCNMEMFSAGGLMLTGTEGSTVDTICGTDGVVSIIRVSGINQSGSNAFFATNLRGDILQINNDGVFEIEDTTNPLVLIWSIGYAGELINFEEGGNMNRIGGCRQYSNFVRVLIQQECDRDQQCDVIAGQISIQNGSLDTIVTVGDGIADVIIPLFTLEAQNIDSSIFIVTDTLDTILAYSSEPNFNFESTDPGVCRLWNIALGGNFSGLEVGLNIHQVMGCVALSNAITITRVEEPCDITASNITLNNARTDTSIIVGDGIADSLSIITTEDATNTDSTLYLITDNLDMILAVISEPVFNFEEAMPGICKMWRIDAKFGFVDNIIAGENTNDLEGCLALSNPLIITRNEVCNISSASITFENSTMDTTIIVGDNLDDTLQFIQTSDASNADTTLYIITDNANMILVVSAESNFNFEPTPPGICIIRRVDTKHSEVGNFMVGQNILDATGCIAISNSLTVTRNRHCPVDAGAISLLNEKTDSTICINDPNADTLSVMVSNVMADSSMFITTDDMNNITRIGLQNIMNTNELSSGISRIYHLAIGEGFAGLNIDQNINNLSGCFDISNFIRIEKVECTTMLAMPSLTLADGSTSMNVCPTDTVAQKIVPVTEDVNNANSTLFIANANSIIIDIIEGDTIDVSQYDESVLFINYISFRDGLVGLEVDSLIMNLEGDFSLGLAIAIIKTVDACPFICDAAIDSISINGSDSLVVCLSIDRGTVNPQVNSVNADTLLWLVTDANNNVVSVQSNLPIDLRQITSDGQYLIYGLAIREDSMLNIGDIMNADSIEECHALSNPIALNFTTNCTVDCTMFNGGMIMTMGENMFDMVCVSDPKPDSIEFLLSEVAEFERALVIIDENNIVVGTSSTNSFDFNSLASGSYEVFNLSYQGFTIPVTIGIDKDEIIDDVCHDYSNSVNIVTVGVESSTVQTSDQRDTVAVCVDDGGSTILNIENSINAGINYFLVVTDMNDLLLEATTNNFIDLANYTQDSVKIYGLRIIRSPSFINNVSIFEQNISDDCFAFSDNFILATKHSGEECTTGLMQDEVEIRANQNPIDQTLSITIDAGNYRGLSHMQIVSNTGSLLMKNTFEINEELMRKEINASKWPTGLIFVTLNIDGELRILKIIKQ